MLIDTHCHIHEASYPINADLAINNAHATGVTKMICIGTSVEDSRVAAKFAAEHENIFAAVGVHPHELASGWSDIAGILDDTSLPIVAVGEIGLDYHYNHSPRDIQIQALQEQIDMALKANLPIIFHVREAFDDFWPIFDNFRGIRGVIHSFTDNELNLQRALDRGLYIGVNGFSTFVKDQIQKQIFAQIPLDRILLETDAPYLTPVPFRGKVNEPAFVRNIADYHSGLRQIPFDRIANMTTANARALFNI